MHMHMSVYVHGPEFRGTPWGWSFKIKIVTFYLYFSIFVIFYLCIHMHMSVYMHGPEVRGIPWGWSYKQL